MGKKIRIVALLLASGAFLSCASISSNTSSPANSGINSGVKALDASTPGGELWLSRTNRTNNR